RRRRHRQPARLRPRLRLQSRPAHDPSQKLPRLVVVAMRLKETGFGPSLFLLLQAAPSGNRTPNAQLDTKVKSNDAEGSCNSHRDGAGASSADGETAQRTGSRN